MAAANFQQPDRIPRYDGFWDESRQKFIEELGLAEDVNLKDYFGVDVRNNRADETLFPTKKAVLSEGKDFKIERDAWGRVIRTVPGGYFYEELDVSVKSRKDLDRLVFDSPYLDSRYEGFVEKVNMLKEKHCVFCSTGGPFIRTAFLRGKAAFLMDIASDPEFARAMSERVADHIVEIGKESLWRGNLYDTGIWIYDDIAYNQGPIISPASFEKIYLPIYKRMVKALKDAGAAKVIFHSDGDVRPLLDMLIEAGINGIHPVESRAGLHIPTLKKKYDKKLVFFGGMCNTLILPNGTKAEIVRHATEIVEAGRDGGVIIGLAVSPEIPVQNYLFYHNTVMEKGCWSKG
jgi:uroporphyrinogen decarboxylase